METRSKRRWARHNLPAHMWPDILSWLPVKSLLRFRSVSKTWRALIDDDPGFRSLHLDRFNNRRRESHFFIAQTKRNLESDCVVRCSKTFEITSKLGTLESLANRHLKSKSGWYPVGSMDGVIMLKNPVSNTEPELMLWNPSIRKVRVLTPPVIDQRETPRGRGVRNIDLDLGFDPFIQDYKHVRFVQTRLDCSLLSAAVYTFGTDSWKAVGGCPNWRLFFERRESGRTKSARSVCLKGVMYLVAKTVVDYKYCLKLVSFNLREERIEWASCPTEKGVDLSKDYDLVITLVDGGSSVAVVNVCEFNRGRIWVLEGHGSESMKWIKRYTFAPRIMEGMGSGRLLAKLMYMKDDGEIVLQWCVGRVTSYNLKTKSEKVVKRWKKVPIWGVTACAYVESLLLLN